MACHNRDLAVGADTPLAGIRVLDLTELVAGPFCTMILASLGAEVIKVERVAGDSYRSRRPSDQVEPVAFHMLHRGKRSVAVDLKAPEGQAAIQAVARSCDVLVQTFRPGVARRLGISEADIRGVRPDIIYCSISAFRKGSAYADYGGVDVVVQAMAGMMSVTGEQGRPPVKAGYPVTDIGAGMWGAIGILAALARRARTGRGDVVSTSMFDGALAWSVLEMSEYLMTGDVPGPLGSAHRFLAPYECFACADGRLLAVGGGLDSHWGVLCRTLGTERLVDDPRFATQYSRYVNAAPLRQALAPVFASRTADEWLSALHAAGIPAGPLLSIGDLANDPDVRDGGMLVETEGFDQPVRVLGDPVRFAEAAPSPMRRGPLLGEHTEDVLLASGLSPAEIEQLAARGVIRCGQA
jgi:crotonobetainyl-CoA:carnitine CoA-transferase CaiB-like acyl-CoA transferase